jgi:hypothetical protein
MLTQRPAPRVDYLAGLDLGQAAQYTALAVVERTRTPDPEEPLRTTRTYAVRYLKRWGLKTAYEDIARDVAGLLAQHPLHRPLLAVDQTGVGQTVVGMIRKAGIPAGLYPVTITFGTAVTPPGDDCSTHLPKRDLAGVLELLLQAQRLRIAALPQRELLAQELRQFRMKPPAGAETVETWRERPHDDLVLAVALACWLGERFPDFEAPCSIPNPAHYRTGPSRLDPYQNRGGAVRLDPYRNRR